MRLLSLLLITITLQAVSQVNPVVTARFSNPTYDFGTRTYCVDAEFQANPGGYELYDMNLRLWYPDLLLEFESVTDLQGGYGLVSPNPPLVSTLNPTFGPSLFGFEGSPEYVNGAVRLLSTNSPILLSSVSWSRLFRVCFHVDDPQAPFDDFFSPSILWDLEEDPANGGFVGGEGMVVTLNDPVNPNLTISADENVIQFNWAYDGIPGNPHGAPFPETIISTRIAPVIRIVSAVANPNEYITLPVRAWNFFDISEIQLQLNYNPAALEYCCTTPDPGIGCNFTASLLMPGSLQIYDHDIEADFANGSALFYITFRYLGGTSVLSWFDDGQSCRCLNANTGQYLYDLPAQDFYVNGNVTTGQYIWTGASSAQWNTPGNWLSNLVPNRFSDVTITDLPLPPHWPSYGGDFSLGVQCRNLALQGNAEMEISGDLVILPGHTLTVGGSGTIHVGGDWVNSGTFLPGTGTVEFTGPSPGYITPGVSPVGDVAGFGLETFPAGMTPLPGAAAGFAGNNAHLDVNIGFAFYYLGIPYAQVRLNTNGWLSFNLTGEDANTHCNFILFNTAQPSTAVSPWWDDLNADGNAKVSYVTSGTAPNRTFTAEWRNVLSYSFGSTARLNFQVKLYETSGIIEFCYGDLMAGVHAVHEGASIGIKDAIGGPGHFREAIYGTTHRMVGCLLSQEDWPQVNYRFIPPQGNQQEVFYRINVTPAAPLIIENDVRVSGVE